VVGDAVAADALALAGIIGARAGLQIPFLFAFHSVNSLASLLQIADALYLNIFRQPLMGHFFDRRLVF